MICDLVNGKLITWRRQWDAYNCKHTYTNTHAKARTSLTDYTYRMLSSVRVTHITRTHTNVLTFHIFHTLIGNTLISSHSTHILYTHTHTGCEWFGKWLLKPLEMTETPQTRTLRNKHMAAIMLTPSESKTHT